MTFSGGVGTYHFAALDDNLGSGGLEENHAQADGGADADAVLEAPEDAGEEGGQERQQVDLCRNDGR